MCKGGCCESFSNIKPILITDVKLKHNVGGKPYVYSIENKKIISTLKIDISISHTKDYATAVAIIFYYLKLLKLILIIRLSIVFNKFVFFNNQMIY